MYYNNNRSCTQPSPSPTRYIETKQLVAPRPSLALALIARRPRPPLSLTVISRDAYMVTSAKYIYDSCTQPSPSPTRYIETKHLVAPDLRSRLL